MNVHYWLYRLLGAPHARAYGRAANRSYAANIDGLLEEGSEIGRLQVDFLRRQGLEPHHRLLDIGCGYLRGGYRFIDYLEPGHYVGIDVDDAGMNAARRTLDRRLFTANWPGLMTNSDLQFAEFDANTFDYALAQSVFSHLPIADIDECLAHIGRVLVPDGGFYATFFHEGDAETSSTLFAYVPDELHRLAESYGLESRLFAEDEYPHPGGQRMMAFEPVIR